MGGGGAAKDNREGVNDGLKQKEKKKEGGEWNFLGPSKTNFTKNDYSGMRKGQTFSLTLSPTHL